MTSGSHSPEATEHRPLFAVERVLGASHRRRGKPCQDEVGVFAVGDVVAVAVADGHGSSRFAEVGARLAVNVTLAALVCFAEGLGEHRHNLKAVKDFAVHPLRDQIVREWAERVRAKAGSEEANLVDYGSTLLFALSTTEYLLLGQIGDGDMLLVGADGEVETPIPGDPSAFADETPSLCGRDAVHSLRIRVLPAPRDERLLLIATDGYGKSYSSDAVFHQIGPDYLEMVRADGFYATAPLLRGFLEQVTMGGSGDDIALAMLYWPPFLRPAKTEQVEGGASEGVNPEGSASKPAEVPPAGEGEPEVAPTDSGRTQTEAAVEEPPMTDAVVEPSPASVPEGNNEAIAVSTTTEVESPVASPEPPSSEKMEIPDERVAESD